MWNWNVVLWKTTCLECLAANICHQLCKNNKNLWHFTYIFIHKMHFLLWMLILSGIWLWNSPKSRPMHWINRRHCFLSLFFAIKIVSQRKKNFQAMKKIFALITQFSSKRSHRWLRWKFKLLFLRNNFSFLIFQFYETLDWTKRMCEH